MPSNDYHTYHLHNSTPLLKFPILNTDLIPNKPLNHINCIYTNATSLGCSKLAELSAICHSEKPHIVFITETWFTTNSVSYLSNYQSFRADRISHGGGVAIFASNSLSIAILPKFQNTISEQLWLNLKLGKDSLILGCIYRPPNSKFDTDSEILHNINLAANLIKSRHYTGLILAGDFNFPNVSWSHLTPEVKGTPNCSSAKFIDCHTENSFTQHVDKPTFIKADNTPSNILDYVITESHNRISLINHLPLLGTSNQGHSLLSWKYYLTSEKIPKKSFSSKYCYSRGNYLGFDNYISDIDWKNVFCNLTVDLCYNKFIELYMSACNNFIPTQIRLSVPKYRSLWMTSDLLALVSQKKKLFYKNLASNWLISNILPVFL